MQGLSTGVGAPTMAAPDVKKPKICGSCQEVGAAMRCQCTAAYYCDENCQKAAWKEHKSKCTTFLKTKIDKERQKNGMDSPAGAVLCFQLGSLLYEQDKLSEAEEWLLEALRIYELLDGREDKPLGSLLHLLGDLYDQQERFEDALKQHKKALRIYRKVSGSNSEDTAKSLQKVGVALLRVGRHDEAMSKMEEARDAARRCGVTGMEASLLTNMSAVLAHMGRMEEAHAMREEAVRLTSGDSEGSAVAMLNHGNSLMMQSRFDEAATHLEGGLAMVRRVFAGFKHSWEGRFMLALGILYCQQGREQESIAMFEGALKIFKKTTGTKGEDYCNAYSNLCQAVRDSGEVDKALEMYEKALTLNRNLFGNKSDHVALCLHNYGATRKINGDLKGAAELLGQARRIYGGNGTANANYFKTLELLKEIQDTGLEVDLEGAVFFSRGRR